MIIRLDEKNLKENNKYIGKKAENLIILKNEGYNVPSGFVISSMYYDAIIKDIKKDIDQIINNIEEKNIKESSKKIVELFTTIKIPKDIEKEILKNIDEEKTYAVRSSGLKEDLNNLSFAGQYETFLNIKGSNNIFLKIIEIYKSIFSQTNLSYLIDNNIETNDLKMAVVIQEMLDSDYSGIAFTINPITGIDKEIVFEVGEGLGENIVSGKITPKKYIYNWFSGTWIEKEINYLNDKLLEEMVRTFLDIQICFGYPCDIEFAIKNEKLYILQSRPITKINYIGIKDEWTTADFKDGGVSATICYQYMWSLYEYIWEDNYRNFLGYAVLHKTKDKLSDMFFGRPYWNLTKAKYGMGNVIGYKEKDFDNELGVEVCYSGDGEVTKLNPITLIKGLIISTRNMKMTNERLKSNSSNQINLNNKYYELLSKIDKVSEDEIEKEWQELIYKDYFLSESIYFNQIFINIISQTLYKSKILEYVNESTYLNFLIGLQDISHLRPYNNLWELSRKINKDKEAFNFWKNTDIKEIIEIYNNNNKSSYDKYYFNDFIKFINDYGYHSEKELDVTFPHFVEDPTNMIKMLKEYILLKDEESPSLNQKKQEEKFFKELNNLKEVLSEEKYKKIEKEILEMREMLWWREEFRDVSTKYYFVIRLYTIKLANYYVKKNIIKDAHDIWYLKIEDINKFINKEIGKEELNNIISRNKKYYSSFKNYINENEIGYKHFNKYDKSTNKSTNLFKAENNRLKLDNKSKKIVGVGSNSGIIKGRARVVFSYSEIDKVENNEILVTKYTDTGWTNIFSKIGGIVTEYGGVLCHAAIVSREYGIPCIVSVKDVTKRIKDGSLIEINGETGEIKIIKE